VPRRAGPDLTRASGFEAFAGAPKPKPARVRAIRTKLAERYGEVTTALDWETPFQLLVATILSAQSTDETVNRATPALFERYPDAQALARADLGTVERLVHSTGFFRNKAKNIVAAAQKLAEDHGGELPRDLDALVALPGVARKTANVVLGTAFGIPSGVVVDTHVARVTRRWAFHDLKDPVKIEQVVAALVPKDEWVAFAHRTIHHGRQLCVAKNPKCDDCPLLPDCPEGLDRLGG
jgi:endonuclease-3